MNWQDIGNCFSTATADRDKPLDEAMREFCGQIQAKVLPKNKDVDWDHIRIELWPDSGRMIAFPANSSQVERIEKAGCQMVFDKLFEEYEKLADSDMEDGEFTSALKAAEQTWIDSFVTTAKSSGLSGLEVQFWDADEEPAILNIKL